ncbi:N-glycosylase/DNA lyase [Candidatus Peregrinibacteria bacterium]|nr:N-glycosylase/DNA lyase [Candidatus Peregrinibacteria bacterium]
MKALENFIQKLEKSGQIELIKNRLKEFEQLFTNGSDEDIFLELLYCLLTAQTSFYRALNAVQQVKDRSISFYDPESIRSVLKENSIRFYNNKTMYIIEASSNMKGIKKLLSSFDAEFEKREWLVKNIKGFGYKEATHFLRNIGFAKSLAILDRHIIRMLHNFDYISEIIFPSTCSKYKNLEEIFLTFAKDLALEPDIADFVLFAYSKANNGTNADEVFSVLKELK